MYAKAKLKNYEGVSFEATILDLLVAMKKHPKSYIRMLVPTVSDYYLEIYFRPNDFWYLHEKAEE